MSPATETLRTTRGGTVALIPARGGSKSIPHKNVAPLGGRPLLAWSIAAARRVASIDRVIVSTDDDGIARVAVEEGAEVMRRPAELATDDALVIDSVRDVLSRLRAEGSAPRVLALLEPTCPLRSADDIERCLDVLRSDDVDSVATFAPAEVNPLRAWRVDGGRPVTFLPGVDPWSPRQRLPDAYRLNGAVYAFRADRLLPEHRAILFGRSAAITMPAERSIDIDGPIDLLVAEAMLAQGGGG